MEVTRQRYVKGHGFRSSSKSFSPSFSKHTHRDRSPKFSQIRRNPNSTSFKSNNNRRSISQELPLHLKRPSKISHSLPHPTKMSSAKRAYQDDEPSGRSSKHQKTSKDDKGPHGLEDLLSGAPILGSLSDNVTSFTPQYIRRDRLFNYRRTLRQKRALAKAIQSDYKLMPVGNQCGLANITGDLCYRNSLFQALLHSPKFCNWLIYDHRPRDCFNDEIEDCVACAIRKLVIAYWRGVEVTSELRIINRLFAKLRWYPNGDGELGGQGDPEGMLTWIMEQMRSQLTKKAYRSYEASHSIVFDSGVTCQCGHSSLSENNLEGCIPIDLAVTIPQNLLNGYLDLHFNTKVSGYRCEKCNDNTTDKTRTQRITHFPESLVLQLKRFEYGRPKNTKRIVYEETLDLESFRSDKNTSNATYKLFAVVAHWGDKHEGHYVCFAKDRDDKWQKFNDSTKSASNLKVVLAPGGGFTPYLLFYQRNEDKKF